MIKILLILFILFLIHGLINIYNNKLNFYNWYEAFSLMIIDKFIIKGVSSYMGFLILIYFIFLTLVYLRKINLPKID